MRRSKFDPIQLKGLYVQQGWTMAKLAAHFGCGETTIRRKLAKAGIPSRPRGPFVNRASQYSWSPELGYAVGVIATDGNLSNDGRHLTVTSNDAEFLAIVARCLNVRAAVLPANSSGRVYRLQWSDRRLYDWLLGIGLMPNKSLRLGKIAIPDDDFPDFLPGCIDGDGSIVTYTDRYTTYKGAQYSCSRLFIMIVSASRPFLAWLQDTVRRLHDVDGALIAQKPRPGHSQLWTLKYAKTASIQILPWIYYKPEVPCLERKRLRAQDYLESSPGTGAAGYQV